jgi:hypothetical protein
MRSIEIPAKYHCGNQSDIKDAERITVSTDHPGFPGPLNARLPIPAATSFFIQFIIRRHLL